MVLKVTTLAELLLTNLTCQPSTFIVWLQQMCLELVKECKTVWTVSTWVWLCTSVNTNMTLQFNVCLKHHSTVRTLCIWRLCSCKLLEWLKHLLHGEHLYGLSPVWTLMWLCRFPDSLNALLHTWQLLRFLSTVNSSVSNKVSSRCESFVTIITFKQFLSRMNSTVFC